MDNWQRLERIIKWTGLSINSFALSIGLKRSENLYQIKKGNNGISRDLVELISTKYPHISKGWLMTGEGEMFIEQAQLLAKNNIPYFGVDAVFAVTTPTEKLPEPLFNISLPPFGDSTLAALNLHHSMEPEIPSGAIIILRNYEGRSVVPGETYLIISENFRGIRKIRLSQDPSEYTLIPANMEDFDPITISKESIEMLFLVTGVIINRTT